MSDLHLEFEKLTPVNAGADVLVLAGDILVASYLDKSSASPYFARAEEFRNFMRLASDRFREVVFVKGNHEHYHGKINKTQKILDREFGTLPNLHMLEDSYVDIDGVRFIGSTLWTDQNNGDPMTQSHLSFAMNDFRIIEKEPYGRFMPSDASRLHLASKNMIDRHYQDAPGKIVVVSHMAPSPQSVHARYKADILMNGGYFSDMEQFIEDHPKIELWMHGHMHDSFDYSVGTTRVVCNPRGYNGENRNFDLGKLLNV